MEKNLDFSEVKEKFRAATSSVLMVHLKKCLDGKNPKWTEMWYDFVENHDKKIAITGKGGKDFMPQNDLSKLSKEERLQLLELTQKTIGN